MSRRPDPTAPRPVLRLLRDADGPAGRRIFAVHPGALAASEWEALAGRLPADTALYLLDLGNVPAFLTAALDPRAPAVPIGDLAARCLDELAAARIDTEPFTLVGWSFGGVVAYEIAARLDGSGRSELLRDLVLLDSIAPVPAFKRTDELLDAAMLLDWFVMYLGAKRRKSFTLGIPPLATPEDGLPLVLDAAIAQGLLPADTELAGLRKLYAAYQGGLSRNNRCTAPYEPGPLERPLTLVKPERSLLPAEGNLGWSGLSSRPVRQMDVPGDHYTMLRDPGAVHVLADLLADSAVV
ncbi:thioesterase domain-containing protein [Streptomyces sp. H27-S2]|uniref:thioesterase domain-containing protein n=1 Tax=Streptomyces antarcticus TaxID=2996458 RepID=UPI00226D7345|nr:alpha/beta fold hydrolase [Streptomyces sp. H27-S2]MCY0954256.1 alpha/beta fold hydrolase [Streptomyces sp. H27-S2]